jgi:hypothetical protein
VANLASLASVKGLCANVTTVGFPGRSTASASLTEGTVGTTTDPCVKGDNDGKGDSYLQKASLWKNTSSGKSDACKKGDDDNELYDKSDCYARSDAYAFIDAYGKGTSSGKTNAPKSNLSAKSNASKGDSSKSDSSKGASDGNGSDIPTITVRAIRSTSTTTCDGSTGTTTIDYLAVGNRVVIAVPTQIAPNTTLTVGLVKLVLNEQIPFSSPDRGLRVNALHATANVLGLAKTDVIVASSESDIANCP